jgi:hypothetical protein
MHETLLSETDGILKLIVTRVEIKMATLVAVLPLNFIVDVLNQRFTYS